MTDFLDFQKRFNDKKVCVIIPTYNNCATLESVINGVKSYTNNIIIVNDGSTDETQVLLEKYSYLEIISYLKNVGKGWALREGFRKALEKGFDYAITIDSDGQHFPSDLPMFINKLGESPDSLIIGARNMGQPGIPGKSSFGNKFSNFWFWVETGVFIKDTQSGYRLYPVKFYKQISFYTKKYEFEIEVLVRSAWKEIKVLTIPVSVFYALKENRVSHFRPFQDFTRISILNTILVILALLFFRPLIILKKLARKETYHYLFLQLYNPNDSIWVKTFSVAFGIFMGILPIWGFQMILAIALSMVFKLNKMLVLISANISLPPLIPVIIYLSYRFGKIWVPHNSVNLKWGDQITLDSIKTNLVQYVYGGISLAILASVIFGLLTFTLLYFLERRNIKNYN